MTQASNYVVVDTDVVSYLFSGRPEAAPFRSFLIGTIGAISFVTIGELLKGAILKGWSKRRTDQMMSAVKGTYVVLPYDIAVAEEWAALVAACKGSTPGVNDSWIAATAVAYACPVLANDHGYRVMAEKYPKLTVLP